MVGWSDSHSALFHAALYFMDAEEEGRADLSFWWFHSDISGAQKIKVKTRCPLGSLGQLEVGTSPNALLYAIGTPGQKESKHISQMKP